MISYEKNVMDNGLTVIVHYDKTTPMVAVNTLFDVGARDEDENNTGFAHLFEHLMFGGSVNIPDFDVPLQRAGGQSNAFTSNDLTNYYETIPVSNIETALWLESDRMLSLAFTDKSLEVQRSVVIEEFKQRYLNQPYGDVWHLLRKEAYKVHPYRWPTIGKDISHIEDATMDQVKAFFNKHYTPSNAILCISGAVETQKAFELVDKWYSEIPKGEKPVRNLPQEPKQQALRLIEQTADVPANALYMAFKMCDKRHADYRATDLISDILGRGKSSRMFDKLVSDARAFTNVSAYVMGSLDDGMFVVSGMLNDGITHEEAEKRVWDVLDELVSNGVGEEELKKVKNKYESAKLFGDTSILNKAMNLCFFELEGNVSEVNEDLSKYMAVSTADINRVTRQIFTKNRCTILRYHSSNQ